MAGIRATEECLREQSYGKLLSLQRRVIKTDIFGLRVPTVPTLGAVGGRITKMTPEDSGAPGILRKARKSQRQVPEYRRDCSSVPSSLRDTVARTIELRLRGRRRLDVNQTWLESPPKLY